MISENIDTLRQRISSTCARVGRDPLSVTLLGVSKTFSTEAIREAVRAGVADIGENYVQELLGKRKNLMEEAIRWHFIGHLQSNKVKYISEWIHLIHAVDNAGLAEEIDKRARQAGRVIDVLVEVNTTGEASKFGIRPEAALKFVQGLHAFGNIRIAGLMTIGPFLPDPEASRPMFRQLRLLGEELKDLDQSNVEMKHLSMGMTDDFEVAVEEGATIVRIGTAIFGSRRKFN
ncbi:MAG: YggS family pyridoxal phosphate-dependent enzyme [Ignavibacteriae bacterium]|nr:YggS family pyridoxal phosphate-dependent enzyme [Ignavibacteriota bacterium]